jgi:hypothetical protein
MDQVHQEATYIAIKNSARCKLLILGLMAALAKTSAVPNIDLSQEKRLRE